MTTYEIRDVDLPGEPPVAVAEDYAAALRTVAALHAAFHAQLDANGEGASTLSQRLSVIAVQTGSPPAIRALSTVSGYH